MSEEYDECGCGCDNQSSEEYCKSTSPKVTIPDPELTDEKKFRCPIDQQLYDSREDYEAHCKEEHDVL
jgi:hypothetical protein